MLECRGLRRRFGDLVAVDGVGFGIDAGETYRLLGPNGAGKTTTISMIAGLLEPTDDGLDLVVDDARENLPAILADAADAGAAIKIGGGHRTGPGGGFPAPDRPGSLRLTGPEGTCEPHC
jgi:ABC-type uncharacterized transport system ATPase subunit